MWFEVVGGKHDGKYKCCLCGGVTADPPPYPTPAGWTPETYLLPLTEAERRMCVNPAARKK